MSTNHRHLAIIPARRGSKGLPGKNIRLLDGLPLIAWTIKTAVASNLFDLIFLSTDSEEYAAIGQAYGASVPWLREPELASDEAPTTRVILEIIERLEQQGEKFSAFSLLQPTSPLRTAEDIIKAGTLFLEKQAGSVVGVSPCEHPPQWCNSLPDDGTMHHFVPEHFRVTRQQLEPMFRINGAIYISDVEWFKQHQDFLAPGSFAYVMPMERSIDIDSATDFMLAETIIHSKEYQKPWIR
jgi:CMP-N,N'-diacetyllegionaminic acid synthase